MTVSRRNVLAAAGTALLSAQGSAPPGIGIVGCGNRSRAHQSGLKPITEAKVVAISDIQPDKLTAFNQGLPSPAATYHDYRELLRDKNVGVVVIATPGYLHKEMALAALRAGKDLLLEKPIATTYADAIEILREAKRSNRIVAVGMQRRYWAADTAVRETVEAGTIGQVRHISFSELRGDWAPGGWKYTDPATGKTGNWRMFKKAAGSTELEFSVHAFSEVTSLVKAPLTKLFGTGGVVHYTDGRDTRDLTSFVAEFGNGTRFTYSFSCFAPGSGSTLTIIGDKGVLTRGQGKQIMLQLTGKRAEPLAYTPKSTEDPETLMYREFFRNVRERTPSPIGPEAALEAAKIAYAADMSIDGQRVVTGRDFPNG